MSIKLGLIGTGPRGRVYANAIKEINEGLSEPRAEWLAICDIDADKRARFCETHELSGTQIEDAGDLLAMPDLDAVVICTPDHTHRDLAVMCYEHGKHVLGEKPGAVDPQGARDGCRAALDADKVRVSGFVLRFDPMAVKLREMVRGGAVGRLLGGTVHEAVGYHHGSTYFRRWHRLRKYSGDLLLHKGCHTLDLFNWITGVFPQRVAAFGGTEIFLPRSDAAMQCRDCSVEDCIYRVTPPEEEPAERSGSSGAGALPIDACVYNVDKDSTDTVFLSAEFDERVRLSYTMTLSHQHDQRRFNFIGTEGEIIAVMGRSEYTMELRHIPEEEPEIIPIERPEGGGHKLADVDLMSDFLDRIERGDDPEQGIRYAYHSGSVAFAAIDSIESGSIVQIEEL